MFLSRTCEGSELHDAFEGVLFQYAGSPPKKGLIAGEGKKPESIKPKPSRKRKMLSSMNTKSVQVEILDTIDVTGFSQEIRDHYKSNVLPLLQRLVPQGKALNMVFLSDPPTLEIRRNLH